MKKLTKAMEKAKEKVGVIGGGALVAHTMLVARHLDNDGNEITRRVVKDRVVTNAFVLDIVDILTGTTGDIDTFDNYKFHDSGTGATTELATNTAMQTACGDSRDAGTQVDTTHTYTSVATHTYTTGSSGAITEHGIFNASSGGTLMDRTVFAAINVASGNQIQFTFTISFSSGG